MDADAVLEQGAELGRYARVDEDAVAHGRDSIALLVAGKPAAALEQAGGLEAFLAAEDEDDRRQVALGPEVADGPR